MQTGDPLYDWREHVGRDLLKLDFRPHGSDPFSASMQPVLMEGEVRIVRHRHSPGFTFRDRALVKDSPLSQTLVFPLRGGLAYSQHGSSGRLAAREATMLSNFDVGEIGAPHAADFFAIVVPGELPRSSDLVAHRWRRGSGCLRLLQSYVLLLAREGVASAEASAAAARHIRDLLARAAHEQSAAPDETDIAMANSVQQVRLRTALGFIGRHFRDPALSEHAVAASQGISVRYLQRLLEQGSIRFTAHVNELRLQEALRLLAEPAAASRTILDIALASGFSDISHFNRLFRRRFGATPTALRGHLTRH